LPFQAVFLNFRVMTGLAIRREGANSGLRTTEVRVTRGAFSPTNPVFTIRGLAAVQTRRTEQMNKGDLVATVAEKTSTSRTQAGDIIEAALTVITDALKKGEEVKLVGFGTFTVADRAAGVARNPRTGEQIAVPASKAPKFKAGQGLKDAVNNKG
jgi:DNA-binding protein HU-beta